MSPFSHFLHELRMRRGIRQAELAEMTGYEQSYISALEVGLKGPPTREFVDQLIHVLELPAEEAHEAKTMADASERKLVLDKDCPQDLYWMLRDMREHLRHLHPRHVKMIRDVLEMAGEFPARQPEVPRRLPRRRQEEAPM
jgi:transcriptional regulator with XRE-family HTH domain